MLLNKMFLQDTGTRVRGKLSGEICLGLSYMRVNEVLTVTRIALKLINGNVFL